MLKTSKSELVNLRYYNARAVFPVRSSSACQIAAFAPGGGWSAAGAAKVRYFISGAGPFDFGAAKTIAAGGGRVAIASTEMESVTEIVVDWAGVEAGDVHVQVSCDQETPA